MRPSGSSFGQRASPVFKMSSPLFLQLRYEHYEKSHHQILQRYVTRLLKNLYLLQKVAALHKLNNKQVCHLLAFAFNFGLV